MDKPSTSRQLVNSASTSRSNLTRQERQDAENRCRICGCKIAKDASKAKSRVWKKVMWFTRKGKSGKQDICQCEELNNSEFVSTSREVLSSPWSFTRNASRKFRISSRKRQSKAHSAKKSFHDRRRDLNDTFKENSEVCSSRSSKPDSPTATGSFCDFGSNGQVTSARKTRHALVLTGIARELNPPALQPLRNFNHKSLKELSKSLSSSCVSSTLAPVSNSPMSEKGVRRWKSFSGPFPNGSPFKRRSTTPQSKTADISSPPLKQKCYGLRRTATFHGKLNTDFSKAHIKKSKSVNTAEVIKFGKGSSSMGEIKDQDGSIVGIVHFYKSPKGICVRRLGSFNQGIKTTKIASDDALLMPKNQGRDSKICEAKVVTNTNDKPDNMVQCQSFPSVQQPEEPISEEVNQTLALQNTQDPSISSQNEESSNSDKKLNVKKSFHPKLSFSDISFSSTPKVDHYSLTSMYSQDFELSSICVASTSTDYVRETVDLHSVNKPVAVSPLSTNHHLQESGSASCLTEVIDDSCSQTCLETEFESIDLSKSKSSVVCSLLCNLADEMDEKVNCELTSDDRLESLSCEQKLECGSVDDEKAKIELSENSKFITEHQHGLELDDKTSSDNAASDQDKMHQSSFNEGNTSVAIRDLDHPVQNTLCCNDQLYSNISAEENILDVMEGTDQIPVDRREVRTKSEIVIQKPNNVCAHLLSGSVQGFLCDRCKHVDQIGGPEIANLAENYQSDVSNDLQGTINCEDSNQDTENVHSNIVEDLIISKEQHTGSCNCEHLRDDMATKFHADSDSSFDFDRIGSGCKLDKNSSHKMTDNLKLTELLETGSKARQIGEDLAMLNHAPSDPDISDKIMSAPSDVQIGSSSVTLKQGTCESCVCNCKKVSLNQSPEEVRRRAWEQVISHEQVKESMPVLPGDHKVPIDVAKVDVSATSDYASCSDEDISSPSDVAINTWKTAEQSELKEAELGVPVLGQVFKMRTELILSWFDEFNDEQKNIVMKKLLNHCELPQMHLLSVAMENNLHKSCPPNCQDMLVWLPYLATLKILMYLDPVSLCRCNQVNKAWNELTDNPLLWQQLARNPDYQLSEASNRRQYKKYTRPNGGIHWKKVLAERFLLQRNWLNGKYTLKTYEGHDQDCSNLYMKNANESFLKLYHKLEARVLSEHKSYDVTSCVSNGCKSKKVSYFEGIACVQFDDTRIVSGSSDKTIKLWDISNTTSELMLTLEGHSGTVRCLDLNGNRLVSGSTDRTIKVWDLSFASYWAGASCKVTMVGHFHTVRCLQADDKKLVSGSYDKTVKVWELKTGQCQLTLRGHTAAVLCVQFDDQKIVSGSYDKKIKVWDLTEGTCLMTLDGHQDAVTCLNLTHDGMKIITGSLDYSLKFWDLFTGKCYGTLDWITSEGHTAVVRCLQVDSWRIISGGDDKTLKVWELATGQRLLTLRYHSDGVTCMQFNDFAIVSGSYDRTVKLWDFTPKHPYLEVVT